MSKENVHDLFVRFFSMTIFLLLLLPLVLTIIKRNENEMERGKKTNDPFDTNVYWINKCHGISRELNKKKKRKKTKTKKNAQEWNLIK